MSTIINLVKTMNEIDEIVEDVYDSTLENPERQALMRSCIKAWLRDAIRRGMVLGREELAIELEVTIKENLNPGASVAVMGRRNL